MKDEKDIRDVRPGEELSEQNLFAYLRSQIPDLTGEIRVKQFPAGSSNLTYLIEIGENEFVLRRPPFGNTVKTAHDMSREFRVLSKLAEVYPPAPRPLLFCGDESIIGSEFYLMERRRGVILRGNVTDELAASSELQKRVCEKFIDNLAKLHGLDYEAAGLGDLGKPEGYARRQTEGWSNRYFKAQTDELPEIENVIKWLNSNIPETARAALVHNDYKFDNVMFNPQDVTEIAAVLDWEMCTVGDPLMDLGTTLGCWISADAPQSLKHSKFNPTVLMENFSRRELIERYAEKTGTDVANMLFYYVFGSFKIAVIAQQIYFRYSRGLTGDARFAKFNQAVAALGQVAARAIETERI